MMLYSLDGKDVLADSLHIIAVSTCDLQVVDSGMVAGEQKTISERVEKLSPSLGELVIASVRKVREMKGGEER